MRAACSAISAGVVFEQLEAAVGAEGLGAGLDRVAAAGDRLGAEPHAGAVVAAEEALGVGDGDLAAGLAVGGGELGDLAARGAAALVQLAQQRRLALGRDVLGALLDRLGVVATASSARGSARSPRSAAAASAAARSRSSGSSPSTWAK